MMPAILVLIMSFVAGPAEKRAAIKKSCADWLFREDPWPMADMDFQELLWSYEQGGLEPKDFAEIETELVHRLAYGLLSRDDEKRVIQAFETKDQDML